MPDTVEPTARTRSTPAHWHYEEGRFEISRLIPNAGHLRDDWDQPDEGLAMLAASLGEFGQTTPIDCTPVQNPLSDEVSAPQLRVIDGHRRLAAARQIGLTHVAVRIVTTPSKAGLDPSQHLWFWATQTLAQKGLTPIQTLRTLHTIRATHLAKTSDSADVAFPTGASLARSLGVSPSTISRDLKLLNQPETIVQAILNKSLPIEAALRLMDAVADDRIRAKVVQQVATENTEQQQRGMPLLEVREVLARAESILSTTRSPAPAPRDELDDAPTSTATRTVRRAATDTQDDGEDCDVNPSAWSVQDTSETDDPLSCELEMVMKVLQGVSNPARKILAQHRSSLPPALLTLLSILVEEQTLADMATLLKKSAA